MARVRLSDGLIHYEYDESQPDPIDEGRPVVKRASHINPVLNSSPPLFVIDWEPWLHELMGESCTVVNDAGQNFHSYADAVTYERQLLAQRYFGPRRA